MLFRSGYQNITLLEEPQAAFYAWIERHPDWRERVQVGDLILVVDIGGGPRLDQSGLRVHRPG